MIQSLLADRPYNLLQADEFLPSPFQQTGKNLPTATREQIQVRLQETDNEPDGVWLEKE